MIVPAARYIVLVLCFCLLAGCLADVPPGGANQPVASPTSTTPPTQEIPFPNSTASVAASPTPLTGTVQATSSPSGADLYWDGAYRGSTPGRIDQVSPGRHAIRMSTTGYQEFIATVDIDGGETATVHADLTISAGGPRQINTSFLEERVHELVNDERMANGLNALDPDLRLSEIARLHSQDMAANNYFEHVNLQGQDATDRGTAAGYTCRKDYGSYYTYGLAENLFQNNLYDSVTYLNSDPISYDWNSVEEIAQTSVDGWMESPGHRRNILTPTFDREGIGVAIATDDKVYITENFC